MRDEKLIELYFGRRESAIRETDRKYGSYCLRIADNILRSREDAEECVNDTWMKAWNSIPPARPAHLKLYLAKIVRNIAFNRYKARNAAKRGGGQMPVILEELEECIPGGPDLEGDYLGEELGACIRQFAHSLPPRECDIFIRRYFFGESAGEIARRYKIRENLVNVVLSRTRQKLKSHLEREGYMV